MGNINGDDAAMKKFLNNSYLYMVDFGRWFENALMNFTCGEKDNLLSLKDFVNKFREVYQFFKEDYDNLKKINIPNDIFIVDIDDSCDERRIVIRPKYLKEYDPNTLTPCGEQVSLVDEGDNYKIIIEGKNNQVIDHDDFVPGYFDLFVEKYGSLFAFLNYLRLGYDMFDCRANRLSFIPQGQGDTNLDSIKIHFFGSSDWNIYYTLDIVVDINTGEIDYNRSKMEIDDYPVPILDNQILDMVYNDTYISHENLKSIFDEFNDFADIMINHEKRFGNRKNKTR